MALKKAEAMALHLKGLPRDGSVVLLTDREAWELLDWYMGELPKDTLRLFKADLAEAKALRDPWHVLEGFLIEGFEVARQSAESH